MSQTLDLYLDISTGSLINGGSVAGALPTLTRNDAYTLRLRLMERDGSGLLRDYSDSTPTIKLGIGNLAAKPSSGEFRLTLSGPVTSSAIAFDASALSVYNAISAIAGSGVTVSSYGVESSAWVITAATANTAMTWGGDAYTLFPSSGVLISTRRSADANTKAQYVVQLARNPAVLATAFSPSSTSGIVNLVKVQDGDASAGKNESYRLDVGKDAIGGSLVLAYGTNATTAIPIGSSAASFTEALSAVTGIGAGNISVEIGNNFGSYNIIFVRDLGQQNVTTALSVDVSGTYFARMFETTVTMGTAELDELFAESGANTISPSIEIELTDGSPRTVYQGGVTVRRDLITQSASVPASRETYYTKTEIDGFGFLKTSTTGFSLSGASRTIYNNSGNARVSVDSTGIGFFAATPVAQPSGPNAVTGLINLGLLASSATYGVLPQSVRTLTTTASVDFGTMAASAVSAFNVTVTGASIGDVVLVGLPGAVSGGIVVQGVVYASNTVCMSAVNSSATTKTVGSASYRVTVIGY